MLHLISLLPFSGLETTNVDWNQLVRKAGPGAVTVPGMVGPGYGSGITESAVMVRH